MKKIYYSLFLIIFLYNCTTSDPPLFDCSETITLAESDASQIRGLDFYPYDSIDSLVFIDSLGATLIFSVKDSLIEDEIIVEKPCDPGQGSFVTTYKWNALIPQANLRSPDLNFTYSLFLERTDLMINGSFNSLLILLLEQGFNEEYPSNNSSLLWDQNLSPIGSRDLRDSFEKFGKSYSDVEVLAAQSAGGVATQMFWNQEFGIVAFTDAQNKLWVLDEII